jgi:N4-bis(aminopropyl)spermidine synthase
VNSLPGNASKAVASEAITDPARLANFYGKSKEPRVHYVKELKRVDYGKAPSDEYKLIPLGEGK